MDDRERLLQIISYFAGTKRIDDAARLHHDLGISGDDAAELIDKVHQEFGTSFEGFEFEPYFPDETEALFYHVAKLLGFKSKRKPLTVSHLLSVIETGRWSEPAT